MYTASLSELKKEIQTIPQQELVDLFTRILKYKKENKELLSYVLFESGNEVLFIQNLKTEVDELFLTVNTNTLYWAKKTLRKILRHITKYCKYSGKAQTSIEMLIHFCNGMKALNLNISRNKVLHNMYIAQLKKINSLLITLHEDLQYDYQERITALQL